MTAWPRSPNSPRWHALAFFTIPGYGIALLIGAYVLWTFGRFDGAAREHPGPRERATVGPLEQQNLGSCVAVAQQHDGRRDGVDVAEFESHG